MARKLYISLGTGKNQKPLIEAAKKEGFKIIGVDQNPLSEGMELCDYRIIDSILNYRKILYKINTLWYSGTLSGGYCASYGKALLSWSYLSEKLLLLGLGRVLSEIFQDKYEVRKKISGYNNDDFLQPGYFCPDSGFSSKSKVDIEFPVVVKPRSGWAKSNIFTAKNKSDLIRVLKKVSADETAKTTPKKKGKLKPKLKSKPLPKPRKHVESEYIVETIIEGDEITVCGMVQDFEFLLLSISDKVTSKEAPFIELEHNFPSGYYSMEDKIVNAHNFIIKNFQVNDTPIVSEWKIKEGNLYLVEISLQVPGEFIGSFLIPQACRYDYYKNLVYLTTGKPIKRKVKKRRFKKAKIRYFQNKDEYDSFRSGPFKEKFFNVLNEEPESPPKSNHDRYAAAGFLS